MKRKIDVMTIIALFICIIPFGVYFKLYPQMPQVVTMHYNSAGLADRFANKSSHEILIICALGVFGLIFMKIMGIFVIKFSEKSYEYDINNLKSQINIATFFVTVLFVGISIYFLITTTKSFKFSTLDILKSSNIIVGIIATIIGNYFPKFKQNNFLGFRTKATLSDKTVWFKVQRFAGRVWIVGGVIIIVCSFLLGTISITISSVIAPIAFIVMVIIPMLYANNLSKSS